MNTSKFESMGKIELRAACKEAEIKYGKLDNAGMRAALVAFHNTPAPVEQETKTEQVEQEVSATPARRSSDNVTETTDVNPVDEVSETGPTNVIGAMFGQLNMHMPVLAPITTVQVIDGRRVIAKVTPHVHSRSTDIIVKTPAPERERVANIGYKIEKEREEKNGVKRPSSGTTCSAIWSHFDANPTVAKNLDTVADSNKWDRTTVHVQFYVWRKFNGIKGRQS